MIPHNSSTNIYLGARDDPPEERIYRCLKRRPRPPPLDLSNTTHLIHIPDLETSPIDAPLPVQPSRLNFIRRLPPSGLVSPPLDKSQAVSALALHCALMELVNASNDMNSEAASTPRELIEPESGHHENRVTLSEDYTETTRRYSLSSIQNETHQLKQDDLSDGGDSELSEFSFGGPWGSSFSMHENTNNSTRDAGRPEESRIRDSSLIDSSLPQRDYFAVAQFPPLPPRVKTPMEYLQPLSAPLDIPCSSLPPESASRFSQRPSIDAIQNRSEEQLNATSDNNGPPAHAATPQNGTNIESKSRENDSFGNPELPLVSASPHDIAAPSGLISAEEAQTEENPHQSTTSAFLDNIAAQVFFRGIVLASVFRTAEVSNSPSPTPSVRRIGGVEAMDGSTSNREQRRLNPNSQYPDRQNFLGWRFPSDGIATSSAFPEPRTPRSSPVRTPSRASRGQRTPPGLSTGHVSYATSINSYDHFIYDDESLYGSVLGLRSNRSPQRNHFLASESPLGQRRYSRSLQNTLGVVPEMEPIEANVTEPGLSNQDISPSPRPSQVQYEPSARAITESSSALVSRLNRNGMHQVAEEEEHLGGVDFPNFYASCGIANNQGHENLQLQAPNIGNSITHPRSTSARRPLQPATVIGPNTAPTRPTRNFLYIQSTPRRQHARGPSIVLQQNIAQDTPTRQATPHSRQLHSMPTTRNERVLVNLDFNVPGVGVSPEFATSEHSIVRASERVFEGLTSENNANRESVISTVATEREPTYTRASGNLEEGTVNGSGAEHQSLQVLASGTQVMGVPESTSQTETTTGATETINLGMEPHHYTGDGAGGITPDEDPEKERILVYTESNLQGTNNRKVSKQGFNESKEQTWVGGLSRLNWKKIGLFALLGLTCFLLLSLSLWYLVGWPGTIQKSLDNSRFALRLMNVSHHNDNFALSLELLLEDKSGLSGTLESMSADMKTIAELEKPSLPKLSARRDAGESILFKKLQMPPIGYSGRKSAGGRGTIKVNSTIIPPIELESWGKLLGDVFSRKGNISLSLEGDANFHMGILRTGVHVKKEISLISENTPGGIPDWIKSGFTNWALVDNIDSREIEFWGTMIFANPTNISVYLGNVTFDLLHRDVVIGELYLMDHTLVPGLNTAAGVRALLNQTLFRGNPELLSSFLSTLMVWNPDWETDTQRIHTLRVLGKTSFISGEEIPFLTRAVQAINDTSFIYSNRVGGATDVARLISDISFNELELDLRNARVVQKPQNAGHSEVQIPIRNGKLYFNLNLPVEPERFNMEMLSATHLLQFVNPVSMLPYASIKIEDIMATVSKPAAVEPDGVTFHSPITRKFLDVELAGCIFMVTNQGEFGEYFLSRVMNDRDSRLMLDARLFFNTDTPLGSATLEPIWYQREIAVDGMGLLGREEIEILNPVIKNGIIPPDSNVPQLKLDWEMTFNNLGDFDFELGNIDFEIQYDNEVVGISSINNFTLKPGFHILMANGLLRPSHATEEQSYYQSDLIANIIAGKASTVNLIGSVAPFDAPIGGQLSELEPQQKVLEAQIRSPGFNLIKTVDLIVNQNNQLTGISVQAMNPFHTTMALTFLTANLSTVSNQPGDMAKKLVASIPSQTITRQEIEPMSGDIVHTAKLIGIKADPTTTSELRPSNIITGANTSVVIEGQLGLEIGQFKVLIGYTSSGVNMSIIADGKIG